MPVSVPPACSTRDRRMDRGSKERLHRHDEDRRQEQKRVERADEEVLPCPRRDGRSLGAMLLDELLDRLLRAAAVEEVDGRRDCPGGDAVLDEEVVVAPVPPLDE